MHNFHLTTLALFSSLITASANASIIQIDNNSGSFMLESHPVSGLFSGGEQAFSTDDLSSIHLLLNNWGIDTDGKITILPINTADGLAFVTLIDEELGGGDVTYNSSIGVSSTGSNSLSMFVNDINQDNWTLIESPFFASQTLGSTFVWDSIGSGDGFAWAGLVMGDAVSYTFTDLGAESLHAEAFQFLSWENNSWGIAATESFDANGINVFTGVVIPAPPVALLLTAGVLGYRRRR
jgi:hypothetical protein